MTPLTSSNLVTLGGKRHPGNINEESASTVKYSNVKTRQFPNRFISDCRVRILWSAETDVHCFPKQNNNNNNKKNHVGSMRNIESKALYMISVQLTAEMDARET